ncbi:MAG: c-type cytochrome domain-containing protein [Opitutales bacterium]
MIKRISSSSSPRPLEIRVGLQTAGRAFSRFSLFLFAGALPVFLLVSAGNAAPEDAEPVIDLWGEEVDLSLLPEAADRPIDFVAEIKPLFEASCLECHSGDRPKSRYGMETREDTLAGGREGTAIFPGESYKSPLIHYVTRLVEDLEMPPEDEGDPLTPEQISILRAWVDQGAEWPEGMVLSEAGEEDVAAEEAEEADSVAAAPEPTEPVIDLWGEEVDLSLIPEAAEHSIDFVAEIKPLFEASCLECHSGDRPKSRYGMETREDTLAGGREGTAIFPGESYKSPLIHYVTRLVEDLEMPPEDEGDPLTPEQISILRAWVDQGAEWPQGLVLEMDDQDGAAAVSTAQVVLDDSPEIREAIARVEEFGGSVRQVARNVSWREADFSLGGREAPDEALAHLKQVSPLVRLRLGRTQVTDAGLAHLASMNDLTHLHLDNTGVTDEGLKHLAGLENLIYLNLYGTEVTDAGLEHIKGLTNLRSLYLWQTDVTQEGVAALREALTELTVIQGWGS